LKISGDLTGPAPTRFESKLATVVLVIAIAAGIGFRLRMLLMHRSLWLDPAMLALNVVDKSYRELLGPLDLNQAAPFGFLLVSKLLGSPFDYSELSLTMFPFLLGIGGLALFCALAREALRPIPGAVACVLMAACSTAVYYSGEFKQYSGDLFVSILILGSARQVLRRDFSGRSITAFVAAGLAAISLSHVAPVLVTGTGMALVGAALARGSPALRKMVIGFAILVAVYLVVFVVQIRPTVHSDIVRANAAGFAPVPVGSDDVVGWWFRAISGYAAFPLGFGSWAWLGLASIVTGVIAVTTIGTHRLWGAVLVMPWLVLSATSVAGLYPMATGRNEVHSRFMLFTVPFAVLLIGHGVEWISKLTRRPSPAAMILGLVLCLPPTVRIARWPNFARQEMRPLVAELRLQRHTGDEVYVYHAAEPAFRFYTRKFPIDHVAGRMFTDWEEGIARELDRVLSNTRLWVVISHDYRGYRHAFRRELRRRYATVTTTDYPGAWLLLAEPDVTRSTRIQPW
jgi:hypothetical protein